MPHLIIESTSPIAKDVIKELHAELAAQETVELPAVKTRFYGSLISLKGDLNDNDNEHVALTVKLLSGRSTELKTEISKNIFAKATSLLPNISLSVDVVDLGQYTK